MTDIIHSILPTSAPSPNRSATHNLPAPQPDVSDSDSVVASLNPAAKYLSEQGMDFAQASVSGKGELHFNIRFTASASSSVTAMGQHSQQTGEFEITMDFSFASSRQVDGNSSTTTTEGQLHITGTIKSSQVHIPKAPNENLVSLLRRVIKDLGKLASTMKGSGVDRVLTKQQLDKLTAIESAEAEQKLSSIAEILIMIAKLKQLLRDGQQPDKLAPERGNTRETLATEASGQLTHFRLEIREYMVRAADLQMPGKTDSVSLVSDFDAENTDTGAAVDSAADSL